MSLWYLVLMGAMTAAVLVVALIAFLPEGSTRAERRLDKLGAVVGLVVAPQVVPVLLRRSDRARRYRATGAAIAWVGAAGGCLLQSGWSVTPVDFWFPYVALIGGATLGSGIAAIVDARVRSAVIDTRVARVHAVTIDDYLPRLQMRMVSVAAVAALIAVWTALAAEGPVAGLIGLLVLVVLAVALMHIGSRVIVADPQPASAPVELAWDDAIRSQNLYMVVYGSITVCFYATLGALVTVTQWATANRIGPPSTGPQLTTVIATVAASVAMLVFAVTRRNRYYRDRLWPDLGAENTDLGAENTEQPKDASQVRQAGGAPL